MSICGQKDERLEELRRKHFITEMTENLPIMRQLMKNVSESSSNDKKNKASLKSKSAMTHLEEDSDSNSDDDSSDTDSSESYCPVCYIVHYDKRGYVLQSLSRCPKFRSLDTKTKLRVVKRSNYCKRCLRVNDAQNHQDGKCQLADDKNIVCNNHETPNVSHHPFLCLEKSQNRENAQTDARDEPETIQF